MNLRTPPHEVHAYTTIYNQPQEGYNVQPKVHVCMYMNLRTRHVPATCERLIQGRYQKVIHSSLSSLNHTAKISYIVHYYYYYYYSSTSLSFDASSEVLGGGRLDLSCGWRGLGEENRYNNSFRSSFLHSKIKDTVAVATTSDS